MFSGNYIVTLQSKCPERQSEGLMRGCSQSYIVPKDTCFYSICECVFFVFCSCVVFAVLPFVHNFESFSGSLLSFKEVLILFWLFLIWRVEISVSHEALFSYHFP